MCAGDDDVEPMAAEQRPVQCDGAANAIAAAIASDTVIR